MDPASEVAAREVFAEKGLEFVGWYHSHPTFDPQPSIRDIENQTQYQVKNYKMNKGVYSSLICSFLINRKCGDAKTVWNHLSVLLLHRMILNMILMYQDFNFG